jgi:hypothetical protein
MKQLINRMTDKKNAKPKPKLKPSLSQKERFIEYAKEVEADESGETFEKSLTKLLDKRRD